MTQQLITVTVDSVTVEDPRIVLIAQTVSDTPQAVLDAAITAWTGLSDEDKADWSFDEMLTNGADNASMVTIMAALRSVLDGGQFS
jgi:hypothetical protein